MDAISADKVTSGLSQIQPNKRSAEEAIPVDLDDKAPEAKKVRRKSMSSDNFPDGIRDDILLRLPIESQVRFMTAVSNSWRSTIQSSAFIRAHLKKKLSARGGIGLFLLRSSHDPLGKEDVYSLHFDYRPSWYGVHTKLPNPFAAYEEVSNGKMPRCWRTLYESKHDCAQDGSQVKVVGICNGLVCLHNGCSSTTLIWNPSIRRLVVLPPPSVPLIRDEIDYGEYYAFGYDSRTDDYKVFRSMTCKKRRQVSCEVEIWSLAKGCWKSLSADVIPANFSPGAFTHHDEQQPFVNGAVHWIHSPPSKAEPRYFIIWFDMSRELFGKIMMPEAALKWHTRSRAYPSVQIGNKVLHISRSGESLALFEKHGGIWPGFSIRFSIWVMKEYGVAESWDKQFTVHLKDKISHGIHVLTQSGEVVLKHGQRYCSVDPKTKELNHFEIYRYHGHYRNIDCFVQSLALLDQPNAISY